MKRIIILALLLSTISYIVSDEDNIDINLQLLNFNLIYISVILTSIAITMSSN